MLLTWPREEPDWDPGQRYDRPRDTTIQAVSHRSPSWSHTTNPHHEKRRTPSLTAMLQEASSPDWYRSHHNWRYGSARDDASEPDDRSAANARYQIPGFKSTALQTIAAWTFCKLYDHEHQQNSLKVFNFFFICVNSNNEFCCQIIIGYYYYHTTVKLLYVICDNWYEHYTALNFWGGGGVGSTYLLLY